MCYVYVVLVDALASEWRSCFSWLLNACLSLYVFVYYFLACFKNFLYPSHKRRFLFVHLSRGRFSRSGNFNVNFVIFLITIMWVYLFILFYLFYCMRSGMTKKFFRFRFKAGVVFNTREIWIGFVYIEYCLCLLHNLISTPHRNNIGTIP